MIKPFGDPPTPSYSNGPQVDWPGNLTVVDLFRSAVREFGDHPAIVSSGATLSYGALHESSSSLAHTLVGHGVTRGDFIPVLVDSGPELPIAILATMMAGAAFVMIPREPPDAIPSTIRPLQSRVVISPRPLNLSGPAITAISPLLDRTQQTYDNALPPLSLDDLAYGFYTSGSTGDPKCTLNLHRGLRNRFLHMNRVLHPREQDVILQTSRPFFDACIWQLLWPLINGLPVVMTDYHDYLDLDQTIDLIQQHRVTVTDFVPSTFDVLCEILSARPVLLEKLRSLRALLIGGEALNPGTVQWFRALFPSVRIINTYGPTEAAIGMMFYDVSDFDTNDIPIGFPISNSCAAIVDEQFRLVPRGRKAQLCIGGDCLGAGYLDDPIRTREAFVDSPFPELHTRRLYKTGDIAYMRDDGAISFVGRADQQVKINGVRVELAHVEKVIRSIAGVHQVVAVAYLAHGRAALAAFLTGERSLTAADVRASARHKLSKEMLPGQFTILEVLPLTTSGKVDRKELERRAVANSTSATDPNAPSPNSTEAALRRLWSEVLPKSSYSSDSNFFEEGGDSLSAQRLVLAIKSQLGVPLTVRDVISAPTIRQLSASISTHSPHTAADQSVHYLHDLDLPPDIQFTPNHSRRSPEVILLTGATGFIGAHLLAHLLRTTRANLLCLVRCPTPRDGWTRLTDALEYYELGSSLPRDRIRLITGDLRAPLLGLDQRLYNDLSQRTTTVIHAGGLVNMLLDYNQHRAPNVIGTREILRFAAAGGAIPVHYLSSLSVIHHAPSLGPTLGTSTALIPEAAVAPAIVWPNGYAQSKWAAEQLLAAASDRGLSVAIYRLDEIMPHSELGVPSRRGLTDLLLLASLTLGACFQSDIVLSYTPVDFVARVVSAGVSTQASGWFHVAVPDPIKLDDLFSPLISQFGVRVVSYREFTNIARTSDAAASPEIARLLTVLPPPSLERAVLRADLHDLFRDTARSVSTACTEELLRVASVPHQRSDGLTLLRRAHALRRLLGNPPP